MAIFPPDLLLDLSKSTVAAVLSVSNFLFWTQSGYFDTAAALRPLLHTWSLGVEEQFYLLWPVVLILAPRLLKPSWIFTVVAALALASLAASVAFLADRSLIYYLLPFRAFELCIGALITFDRWTLPQWARNVAAVVGLALIVGSALTFNKQTVFPTYNALPPTVGAALVLIASGSLISKLALSNRVAVGLGKISYSLYLVHWPLIVFATYWLSRPLTSIEMLEVAAASIALATIMYLAVEHPFRQGKRGIADGRLVAFGIAGLVALVLVPSGASWASGGLPQRYPSDVLALADLRNSAVSGQGARSAECFIGTDRWSDIPPRCYKVRGNKPAVLLLGDSTAYHLGVGLSLYLGKKARVYDWSSSACPPLIGFEVPDYPYCAGNMQEFFAKKLHEYQYDLVILSQNQRAPQFLENFGPVGEALNNAGVPFVLVGQMPFYNDSPRNLILRHRVFEGLPDYLADNLVEKCDGDEHGLDSLVGAGRFFSMKALLCDGATPRFEDAGGLLQLDRLHLSARGSYFAAEHIVPWLVANGLLTLPAK
jgi:peptidoglycan/LPS O-acetylase OafA/YrhL